MKLDSRNEGYSFFLFEPGERESVRCKVCGAKCDVERNIIYRIRVMSHCGTYRYDLFTCPNRNDENHIRAQSIQRRLEDCCPKRGPGEIEGMKNDIELYLKRMGSSQES